MRIHLNKRAKLELNIKPKPKPKPTKINNDLPQTRKNLVNLNSVNKSEDQIQFHQSMNK